VLLAGLEVAVPGGDQGAEWAGRLLRDLGASRAPARSTALRVGRVDTPTHAASPVEDWARSGIVALTGRRGGRPLLPPGIAATAARGAALAVESLSALAGDRVRVDGPALLGERAALLGLRRRGAVSARGGSRILRARDGWVALTLARPHDLAALPAVVERPTAGDPWTAAAAWSRGTAAAEAAERAQLLSVGAAELPDFPPHCRWVRHLAEAPVRPRRSPPLVVDLTSLWAGPLCANLLALAGCRVVQVESRSRPDRTRSSSPAFFDLMHAGHERVTLDLETRRGVDALRRLLEQADLVLESSRPRALVQLGISAEEIVRATGAAWVSLTAYGRDSNWQNRVGFGDDVACAAGLTARDESGPVFCGDAIADPLAGLHAAVVALAAVVSERGGLLNVSMRDVVAATLPPDRPAISQAAVRDRRGWALDTETGRVLLEPPRARLPVGRRVPSTSGTA
jgi:crotonobetainyl-CoA:carnitine CoA-transferase CaiB-like acyl-CoA transferase